MHAGVAQGLIDTRGDGARLGVTHRGREDREAVLHLHLFGKRQVERFSKAGFVLEGAEGPDQGHALFGGFRFLRPEAEFVEDPLAPADARVLRVRIDVDPGDPPLPCAEPILRELDGAQREWRADTDELSTDWDPLFPASCSSEATGPYTLDARWVIPLDATGPFGVDLVSTELWPENLRFVVEP